jgi:DNA-binding NtrC family response regulator
MPGLSGLELVRQIRDLEPDLPCIVITGYGSPEHSVDALRAGAFWYLEKPFDQANLDHVRGMVELAIAHGRLKVENRLMKTQMRSHNRIENMVGQSAAWQQVLEHIRKVADTDSTVLITGESGTGKELIARALHFRSSRADRMFVTVNCGAIPEELLESELFGHVKGAFTNAVAHREGRFSLANSGTIFLDEIGDMSPNLQVKLLRVLQDRTFEPVGSSHTVRVNVRVLAATNQDLEVAIREKRFREDLFYRLNVIPIETPPLRERRDDIPLLVQHFLEIMRREKGRPIESISSDALKLLCDYDWPGNVRQLENVVEQISVLTSHSEIRVEDLPPQLRGPKEPLPFEAPHVSNQGIVFNDVVERIQRDLILQALELSHGNKNRAAQLLGLNRTTLLEKMKKMNLG